MFCPSCGKEVNTGLSYCNFCGVRLGAPEADPSVLSDSAFKWLVGAAIAIPVVGVGLLIKLMESMKGLGFAEGMIFAVVLMTFLLLFLAEAGTFFMLISRTRKPKTKNAAGASTLPAADAAKQIEPVVIKGLQPSSFDGIPSVTEHTTRALDAVPRTGSDD